MEDEFTEIPEEEQTEQPEEVEEETEASEETGEEGAEPATEDEEEKKVVPVKAVMEERRRRQEAEKEVERLKSEKETAAKPAAEKTIYDFYEEDPAGVIRYINGQIQQLNDEDPYGNAAKIEELRDQKVELRQWGQSRATEAQTSYRQQLEKTAPKLDELTKYAAKELGYTADEIKYLTEPTTNKVQADFKLKTLKVIARQFEAANAGSKVEEKRVARTPTIVSGSGSGIPKQSPKLDQLWKEGQRTGDWTDYYKARGIIS